MDLNRYYIIYKKSCRDKINKIVNDFKNIGLIIIRNELDKNKIKIPKRGFEDCNFIVFVDSTMLKQEKDFDKVLNSNMKNVLFVCDDELDMNLRTSYINLANLYIEKYNVIFEKFEECKKDEYKELLYIKEIENLDLRVKGLEKFKEEHGETKNYLVLKANTIYRKKMFKTARDLMDKALDIELKTSKENFEYANLLEEYYGEYTKAKKYYEEAIKLKPNYYDAYYNLAVLMSKIFNDYEKAEEYYDKLISMDSEDERAYYNKAIIVMSQTGDKDKAKALYERAIEISPKCSAAYNNLANLYLSKFEDYEKAKECYEKAIEIDKKDFTFYFNLANIYKIHYKDYNKAREYYQKSIKCEDNIYSRMNLAMLLEENLGDYREAIRNFEKVLEIQPGNKVIIDKLKYLDEKLMKNLTITLEKNK